MYHLKSYFLYIIKHNKIKLLINVVDQKMKNKVCLIVDNPLRDLEGLTLVAWHLAQKDILCYRPYVLSSF